MRDVSAKELHMLARLRGIPCATLGGLTNQATAMHTHSSRSINTLAANFVDGLQVCVGDGTCGRGGGTHD